MNFSIYKQQKLTTLMSIMFCLKQFTFINYFLGFKITTKTIIISETVFNLFIKKFTVDLKSYKVVTKILKLSFKYHRMQDNYYHIERVLFSQGLYYMYLVITYSSDLHK